MGAALGQSVDLSTVYIPTNKLSFVTFVTFHCGLVDKVNMARLDSH